MKPEMEWINNVKDENAAKILQILKRTFSLPTWTKHRRDSFKTLVMAIISQNTTDLNTAKAFEQLSNGFEITPEVLAKASLSQIQNAIRPAGLYRSKSHSIKNAAVTILEKWHGTLQPILSSPIEEARRTLMQFQGIGPKTADVVLLFAAKRPTVPIDTHVKRVATRLGFAPFYGSYEIVRAKLETLFASKDYLNVHLLLIAHGRKTCKARHPLCNKCEVSMYCPTKGQWG